MTAHASVCWHCGVQLLSANQVALWALLGDPRELTQVEMGGELHMAPQSVKNATFILYRRLGVKGRLGAVLKWQEIHRG